MARAFSKDLREKIVSAYELSSDTIEEVAYQFGVGVSTVSKYLGLYRKTGDLTPIKPPGRPPLLNEEHLNIMQEIILSCNDGRLRDYCIAFKEKTGMNISQTTCWEACQKIKARRKKRASMPQSVTALEYKTKETTL